MRYVRADHPVPKNRKSLSNSDWFPFVIGKIAPMEWWHFAASLSDVRREDYPTELRFNLAKQNTWEFPRFCFYFFRPKPDVYAELLSVVDRYKGDVVWFVHDSCIGAFSSRPGFYTPSLSADTEALRHAIVNPPKPDPEFVKRALADIPNFCMYLEVALGLTDKSPVDFDPEWLTKDGLARSREPFEDFLEAGPWSAILTPNPASFDVTLRPSSPEDQVLSFSVGMSEHDALFRELGADWEKFQQNDSLPILPTYPLLSRLNDFYGDAAYQPAEIDALLAECMRAEQIASDPRAIRGLDKLVRIARWAQKTNRGIYFVGD
jgi:hypothetical protein